MLLKAKPSQVDSRIVKSFAKGAYTHICLSKDCNMYDMIGFTNKVTHESIEKFSPNRECKVLELEIDDDQSKRLDEVVNYYFCTTEKFAYNYLGSIICAYIMVPMFNRGVRWHVKLSNKLMSRKNKFTCSNFLMKILYESNIRFLDGINDDNFTPCHTKWSIAAYQYNMLGLNSCFKGTVGELVNQTGGCRFAANSQDFWIKYPVLHAV